MKKTLITLTLASLFATSTVIADEYSGWRVGGGYAQTKMTADTSSIHAEDGEILHASEAEDIKEYFIEAGYDFNGTVGLKISYSQGEGGYGYLESDDYGAELYIREFETKNVSISTDVGHTFKFNSFTVKPYAEVGAVLHSTDLDITERELSSSHYYNDDGSEEALHSGVFGGIGVRTVFNGGIYTDLTISKSRVLNYHDNTEGSAKIALGYKF